MNKLILLFALFFVQLKSQSQNELYQKIKQVIQEKHPEINIHAKLIGCVTWSINDADSKDQLKSFDKTLKVFENAKLKGGSKGIVLLAVNKENLGSEATIFLQKDGILELIPVKLEELSGADLTGLHNVVFDSSGLEVYKDLNSAEVFSSINKLITR